MNTQQKEEEKKRLLLQQPPCYIQALCRRVNINIILKLYDTNSCVVLRVKLQTKREAKLKHKEDTTE